MKIDHTSVKQITLTEPIGSLFIGQQVIRFQDGDIWLILVTDEYYDVTYLDAKLPEQLEQAYQQYLEE